MADFAKINDNPTRQMDGYGSGQFNASRDGGKRHHQGLDVVSRPGEPVKSPIDGDVIAESVPYKNDPRYRGVRIRGTGRHAGYEVKMFYLQGLFCGPVKAGDVVGYAQNLEEKYPGITNHVHMEVRQHGVLLSPLDLYKMCF